MRVWRTNSVFFSPCCSGTDGGCILTKRIGAAKQLEHQKRPNKLSGDVKDEWDLFAKKKKKTIPGNRSRLELFSGLALRGVSGSVAQCLKNPAQYQNPYGSQLPMQGRTHTIPHMRVLRGRDASTQSEAVSPACIFTHTYVCTHTHTHGGGGVGAICGPSHASPMQRCLLAVGVIIGHAGLFLCQRRPCQEMTDNRAQR